MPIPGYKSLTLRENVKEKVLEKAKKSNKSPSDLLEKMLEVCEEIPL